MAADLSPGVFVKAVEAPEWGLGQVQSVIGTRATVNFEHRGKVVLDLRSARLEPVPPSEPDHRRPDATAR